MTDQLNVEKRETRGTLRMRRLRAEGKIPAVLYGHGQDTVHLSVLAKDVHNAIRHGSHFVELKGDSSDSCLIKEVQWDALGSDVMHLDLTRVDATETVEVTLQIELVGSAPGLKVGGTVRHLLHEIDITCRARAIPDKLVLKINDLQLDGVMTVGDIPLPEGATLSIPDDEIVVQCIIVEELPDEEEEDGAAEPEVIGRKPEEDED